MSNRIARLFLLAVLIYAPAFALQPGVSAIGRAVGSIGSGGSPLGLPLVQSSNLSSMLTFKGSFTSPINYEASALSVSGNTMYLAASYYDPANSSNYADGGGMTEFQLPTLSGTPAYDGSNFTGTIYTTSVTASLTSGSNSITISGINSGSVVAGLTYVLTGTGIPQYTQMSTGSSSGIGTYTMGANATATETNETVTLLMLPVAPATGGTWPPTYPWGNASGYRITGSLVYNGTLYLTAATYYDSSCTAQTGWILSSNPDLDPSTWGTPNTASGYTINPNNYSPGPYSRKYGGQLGLVPSSWQSLVGGPAFVSNGPSVSVLSCGVPIGYSFSAFDPSNVSPAGAAIPVVPALDYFYQGSQTSPSHPMQLSYRSFTGPYPTTAAAGTFTLSAAPSAGATSVTLASPFPNNGVNGLYVSGTTLNAATSGSSLVLNAPTGGWPNTWAANYWVNGQLFDTTTGQDCRISASTSATAGNTATMTVTCPYGTQGSGGFNSGDQYGLTQYTMYTATDNEAPYLATFSDGEQRVVSMSYTSTTVGSPFVSLSGCSSGTCGSAVPLTCSPNCTTSITLAPLGDTYDSETDGPVGGEFIAPGSSSLLVVTFHGYGPQTGRPYSGECGATGGSANNALPVPPDTAQNDAVQIFAYKMSDIVNQKNGVNPIYTANPYAVWNFPTFSNWEDSSCYYTGGFGWAYFDQSTNILYISVGGSGDPGRTKPLIYEFSVSPISWNAYGYPANEEYFHDVA